eukprot:scaffold730_cov311-Pavlova_lutheri.AAC.1
MPLGLGGELPFEMFHLSEKLFPIDNLLSHSLSVTDMIVEEPPQLWSEFGSKHNQEELLPEPPLAIRGAQGTEEWIGGFHAPFNFLAHAQVEVLRTLALALVAAASSRTHSHPTSSG